MKQNTTKFIISFPPLLTIPCNENKQFYTVAIFSLIHANVYTMRIFQKVPKKCNILNNKINIFYFIYFGHFEITSNICNNLCNSWSRITVFVMLILLLIMSFVFSKTKKIDFGSKLQSQYFLQGACLSDFKYWYPLV